MENRLIYFAPKKTLRESPLKLEGAPESRTFISNGEKEYLEIKKQIFSLDVKNLDQSQLTKIFRNIAFLRSNLLNSQFGILNSYVDASEGIGRGQLILRLYQLLRNKLGLDKLRITAKGIMGKLPKNLSKTFASRLIWLADPMETFNHLINNSPGAWPTARIKEIVLRIIDVANYYIYLTSTGEIKKWLNQVRKHSKPGNTPRDLSFKAWFEYQKDNFVFTIPYNTDFLPKDARQLLREACNLISQKAELLTHEKQVARILSKELAHSNKNAIITAVLKKANLIGVAGEEFVRTRLYGFLFWRFYQGLLLNSKLGLKTKQKVLKKYNKFLSKYPALRPNFTGTKGRLSGDVSESLVRAPAKRPSGRTKASEDVSAQLFLPTDVTIPHNVPIIPRLKTGNNKEVKTLSAGIEVNYKKLLKLREALIISLAKASPNNNDLSQFINISYELKTSLYKTFGISQIISLNPNFKEKALKALNYFELFAEAIQNARFLSDYEKKLKQFKGFNTDQYTIGRFYELKGIYGDLKSMSYLPTGQSLRERNMLLGVAEQLVQKWSFVMKMPGTASLPPTPFKSKDAGLWEKRPYRYNPMLSYSADDIEAAESLELPDAMEIQLNRLELIRVLVDNLLLVGRMTNKTSSYIPSVLQGLSDVQKEMIAYYKDPKKYNGVTPFNLNEALQKSSGFKQFLADLKDLFNPRYSREKVFYTDRYQKRHEGLDHLTGSERSKLHQIMLLQHGQLNGIRNGVYWLGRNNPELYRNLYYLISGAKPVTRDTIKKAGTAVAIFIRETLDNYAASRALMAKLLQPHMVNGRESIPAVIKSQLRNEAHSKAVFSVINAMRTQALMIKAKVAFNFKKQYNEKYKKDPPKALIDQVIARGYNDFLERSITAQSEILYQMALDNLVISKGYFSFFGKPDDADNTILSQYRKSMGVGSMSDEIKHFWKNIGVFLGNLALEVIILGVSVISSLAIGTVLRSIFAAFNAVKAARIVRWAFRGAEVLLPLAGEAFVFSEVSSFMHEFVTGEKSDSIVDRMKKGQVWLAFRTLFAEMAMFGSFRAVGFFTRFLKYGKEGRKLLWLAVKNRECSVAIEGIFKELEGLSVKNGMGKLDQIINSGAVKLRGKTLSIPVQVKNILSGLYGDVTQLQAQYFRIIKSSVTNGKLRKVLGFFVQELNFDMAAMMLGTLLKQNLFLRDKKNVELFTAEALFQMYTMGFVFRSSAIGVKGSFGKFTKLFSRLRAKSPIEASIKLSAEIARLEKAGTSTTAAAKLQLAKLRAEQQRLQSAINEAPFGDYIVPSRFARILPKWLRKHFYSHYRGKNGEVLTSDQFAKLLLEDFTYALNLINTSKRSILSPSQILYVIARLSKTQIKQLLPVLKNKLAVWQKLRLISLTESINPDNIEPHQIRQSLLPKKIKGKTSGEIKRMPLWPRLVASHKKFILALFLAGNILTAADAVRAQVSSRPGKRPVAAKTVKAKSGPPPYHISRRSLGNVEVERSDFVIGSGGQKGKYSFTTVEHDSWRAASLKSNLIVLRGTPLGDNRMAGRSATFFWIGRSTATEPAGERLKTLRTLFSGAQGLTIDQKKIYDGLGELMKSFRVSTEGQKKLFGITGSYYDSIPPELKPYFRVILVKEGSNYIPYIIIDQAGLNADMNLGKKDREGGKLPFPTFQTLKKLNLLEENILSNTFLTRWIGKNIDPLALDPWLRISYKFGYLNLLPLFLWLSALGVKLTARIKYRHEIGPASIPVSGNLTGKEPVTRNDLLAALKQHSKKTAKAIRGSKLRHLPLVILRGVWRIFKYPFTRLDIQRRSDTTEPTLKENDFSNLSLARILTAERQILGTLSPLLKGTLQRDYDTLKGNFKQLSFESPENALLLFKSLIKFRAYQLKLEGISNKIALLTTRIQELATKDSAGTISAAERRELATKRGNFTRLTREQNDIRPRQIAIAQEVTTEIFNPQLFSIERLTTPEGLQAMRNSFLFILKTMEGATDIEILKTTRLFNKTLSKISKFLKNHPDIPSIMLRFKAVKAQLIYIRSALSIKKAFVKKLQKKRTLTPDEQSSLNEANTQIRNYQAQYKTLNTQYETLRREWWKVKRSATNIFEGMLKDRNMRVLGSAVVSALLSTVLIILAKSFGLGRYDTQMEAGQPGSGPEYSGGPGESPDRTKDRLKNRDQKQKANDALKAFKRLTGGDEIIPPPSSPNSTPSQVGPSRSLEALRHLSGSPAKAGKPGTGSTTQQVIQKGRRILREITIE